MANRRGCGGLRFFSADSKGSNLRNRRHRGGFVCRIVKSEVCALHGNLTVEQPNFRMASIAPRPPAGRYCQMTGAGIPRSNPADLRVAYRLKTSARSSLLD